MSKLSPATVHLLQIIHEHPVTDGLTLIQRFNLGTQAANHLKLLENHEYIRYVYGDVGEEGDRREGWALTQKGQDVLKYG